MTERYGDLWTYPADWIGIATNGFVKKNGEAVMGRGCAYEATQKIPDIKKTLGAKLTRHGNHVHFLCEFEKKLIISVPTKKHWMDKADIFLIEQSCWELRDLRAAMGEGTVTIALPRLGCGNGQLKWEDVQPIMAGILTEPEYIVCHQKTVYTPKKRQ